MYKQYCDRLHDTGKYRKLPDACLRPPGVDFSTNDYLCLSMNRKLLEAAVRAGEEFGVGATGSRLLSGNKEIFQTLESRIARDKGTEAALIFPSGFQANLSVLESLLDQQVLKARPIVFFDKLNHASLYQAVFLSGAELVRYRHNDMEHLAERADKFRHDCRPKFIVAETIFGMDGDLLPLREVADLAKEHEAFLYLDEAHATGVLGKCGYGLSTTVELKRIPNVVMGTFSKALGCSGAYVACSDIVREYLLNKAAGFIYTTAASPMVMGAVLQSWDMVSSMDAERKQLFATAAYLREGLLRLGFDIGTSSSHIVPVILGQEASTLHAKEQLLREGVIVSAVRPPTVPSGKSRIRIALNVLHTRQAVDRLLAAMSKL